MSDGVNPNEIVMVSDPLEGTIVDGRNGGRRMRGRLAGGVRDKLTMAEMKARMSALWKEGTTYAEIANTVSDEFGLEGPERFKANGIHFHIKNQLEYWRQVGLLHVDERQAMLLARYDQLEMLCMEAYFASCEGKTTTTYNKQVERARSKEREALLLEQIKEEREARNAELHHMKRDNPKFQFELNDGELGEIMIDTAEKMQNYTRHEQSAAGDPKWIRLILDINDKRAGLWGLKNKKVDNADQEIARLSDEQRDERIATVISSALARRAEKNSNLAEPAPLGGWEEEDTVPDMPDMPDMAVPGSLTDDIPVEVVEEQIDEVSDSEYVPEVDDDFRFDFDIEEE